MSVETGRLRFGVYELNLAARELCKHGIRLKLRGQPFEILAILLEKPGEIVTREVMQKRLWPADTFVDFEHSLNSAIKKLRQALGDSPENSRYIETIPRVGYRDRKSTRLNSSHRCISYAVFCLNKKKPTAAYDDRYDS